MKKLQIITKQVANETVSSKQLMIAALSANQEALKGLKELRQAIKLYDKIEASGDVLELEDAEFDLLYSSLDKMQWGGGALVFGDFFDEIVRIKNE